MLSLLIVLFSLIPSTIFGQKLEDCLFDYEIIGHYQYGKNHI